MLKVYSQILLQFLHLDYQRWISIKVEALGRNPHSFLLWLDSDNQLVGRECFSFFRCTSEFEEMHQFKLEFLDGPPPHYQRQVLNGIFEFRPYFMNQFKAQRTILYFLWFFESLFLWFIVLPLEPDFVHLHLLNHLALLMKADLAC